jgi:hypothetical protein
LECGRLAHPSPDWKLISGSPNWVCSFTATGFTASPDPPACLNASALHQCRKARGLPPRASNGCRSFAKTERAVILFIIYSSHILQHSRKRFTDIIHGILFRNRQFRVVHNREKWKAVRVSIKRNRRICGNSTWDLAASPSPLWTGKRI